VATEHDGHSRDAPPPQVEVTVRGSAPPAHGLHCPPGQAKKGRC
jgi:hypothetical protein